MRPIHPAPSHVRFARADDDLVWLDLKAEEYGMTTRVGDRLRVLAPNLLEIADRAMAKALREAGLVGDLGDAPVEPILIAATDLRHARSARPAAGDLLRFIRLQATLATKFRGQSLSRLVATARRWRAEGLEDPQRAAAEALVLRQLWPLAPIGGRCLLQSFALLAWLRGAGLSAQWILGVRTWPFEAHCWVQTGDTLLNETTERAATFSPILSS